MTTQRQQRKRPRETTTSRDRRFYGGREWTREQVSRMARRNVEPMTINLIKSGSPIMRDGTAADPDEFGVAYIDARPYN